MKRRSILSCMLALLVMLTMTACGGSSDSSGGSTSYGSAKTQSAPSAVMDDSAAYWSAEAPAEVPAPGSSASYNGSAEAYDSDAGEGGEAEESGPELPEGVKMIYRATMELESTEFEKAAADIKALTAALGGYFESQSMWNRSGGYRSAQYTVRVPAARFETFLSQIGSLCTIRYQTQSAENVSEYYYDMESRLQTQKIKLARLQDLLSKAEEMEDIITLESAISDTEYQIESLSGELRHYDALIGYSTIEVTLSEVYRVTEQQTAPLTFGERVARSFREGLEDFGENVEDFIEWLAYSWLSLRVFFAIIFGAIKLFRRIRRKGGSPKKKKGKDTVPADADTQLPKGPIDPNGSAGE